VIEAISEAVMLKALDPTNPKQVDAARYVTTEMGMAESQTKSSEEAQQFADIAQAVRQLAAFLRGGGEIVDGSAVDMPALTDGGE
jgi:hypothetical protein